MKIPFDKTLAKKGLPIYTHTSKSPFEPVLIVDIDYDYKCDVDCLKIRAKTSDGKIMTFTDEGRYYISGKESPHDLFHIVSINHDKFVQIPFYSTLANDNVYTENGYEVYDVNFHHKYNKINGKLPISFDSDSQYYISGKISGVGELWWSIDGKALNFSSSFPYDNFPRCGDLVLRYYRHNVNCMEDIKINIPEGCEIDKEKSVIDFEKNIVDIKLKRKIKRWRDNEQNLINGYFISTCSNIGNCDSYYNIPVNYNIFATEKHAKSALAVARISQIMTNDERFGGIITDEEWANDTLKYVIERNNGVISHCASCTTYHFLAFHTYEQRDLFLKENIDLIKEYFMIS